MEIVSNSLNFIGVIGIAIAVMLLLAMLTGYVLQRIRRETTRSADAPTIDLRDPVNRESLQAFLIRHGIVGDADIRDGLVRRAVTAPEMTDPLARSLIQAVNMMDRLQNKNANVLYLRDSKKDRWLATPLDMEIVMEAALTIAQVAEERKRSDKTT